MPVTTTLRPVLTTPPTRMALGSDSWYAREKTVDAIGNLNIAVKNLQSIVAPDAFPAVPNEFLISYNSSTGEFTAAQPNFSNLSGSLSSGQLPAGVPQVSFGSGAPGATSVEGYMYFDTSVTPYQGYVWHSAAWHQFS